MNSVEPIRDRRKIETIKGLLKATNKRDYLLFVMGINTGLRISDLLKLKVEDVSNGRGIFDGVYIREEKTGKMKRFGLNIVCQEALIEYLSETGLPLDQYLFKSKRGEHPIDRIQAYRVINKAARQVGLDYHIGTHTLRKTFGYHARKQGVPIELLQKVFNHATPLITLRYLGITQDEIDDVYARINL